MVKARTQKWRMIGKTIKGNGFSEVWRYIYDEVKKLCLTYELEGIFLLAEEEQMIGKTIKGNGFSEVWRYIYDKVKKLFSLPQKWQLLELTIRTQDLVNDWKNYQRQRI